MTDKDAPFNLTFNDVDSIELTTECVCGNRLANCTCDDEDLDSLFSSAFVDLDQNSVDIWASDNEADDLLDVPDLDNDDDLNLDYNPTFGSESDDPFYSSFSESSSNDERRAPVEDVEPDYFDGHLYPREELIEIRREITDKLSSIARFVRLKPGTKIPVGRFDDANTSKIVPFDTDYGVVPKRNLLILDIDSHGKKGTTPDEQVAMFSEFLGVDLRQSFTVITPSGGYHMYLLIPENRGQLSAGLQNLNGYQGAISKILGRDVIVDGDLRTGKSAGYAVGPTSAYLQDEKDKNDTEVRDFYRIADASDGFSSMGAKADLLYISDEGFERLSQLKDVKKEIAEAEALARRILRRELRREAAARIKEQNGSLPAADKSEATDRLPSPEYLKKLERELKSRNFVTYHRKRSFVKAALHCCHTNVAIAKVCTLFDIDRDSSTQDQISNYELMRDITRFTPSASFHGGYCEKSVKTKLVGSNFVSEDEKFDLNKFKEKNAEKVATRTISRHKPGYHSEVNPRVLDVSKISKTLLANSKRKNPSQQYYDAMAVVDYFLQPLSNVGAKTVLLARTALEQRLDLTPSRAAQALRILRDRGIVSVVDKQRTGLAPTYSVDEKFTHQRLTKTIKMLWGFNGVPLASGELDDDGNPKKTHANLYLDRHTGLFREVFTDKIVESNFALVSSWIHTMNSETTAEASGSTGPGAATSYLKSEANVRGLTVVPGSETLLVEESTGEIVSATEDDRASSAVDRLSSSGQGSPTLDSNSSGSSKFVRMLSDSTVRDLLMYSSSDNFAASSMPATLISLAESPP